MPQAGAQIIPPGDQCQRGGAPERDQPDQLDPAERGQGAGEESLPGSLRIFDVVTHTIEAMESIVTAYRMAGNRPDVLVEVPSDACSTFDFHRADELIALGRRLTAEALDRAGI